RPGPPGPTRGGRAPPRPPPVAHPLPRPELAAQRRRPASAALGDAAGQLAGDCRAGLVWGNAGPPPRTVTLARLSAAGGRQRRDAGTARPQRRACRLRRRGYAAQLAPAVLGRRPAGSRRGPVLSRTEPGAGPGRAGRGPVGALPSAGAGAGRGAGAVVVVGRIPDGALRLPPLP